MSINDITRYIKDNDLENVKSFIQENPDFDVNMISGDKNILGFVSKYNRIEILKYFYSLNIFNFNILLFGFLTPLSIACVEGATEVVKFYFHKRKELNIVIFTDDPFAVFKCHFFFAYFRGRVEIVKFLYSVRQELALEYPKYYEVERDMFNVACRHGYLEIVKFVCLNSDIDLTIVHDGLNIFTSILSSGNVEILKFLYSYQKYIKVDFYGLSRFNYFTSELSTEDDEKLANNQKKMIKFLMLKSIINEDNFESLFEHFPLKEEFVSYFSDIGIYYLWIKELDMNYPAEALVLVLLTCEGYFKYNPEFNFMYIMIDLPLELQKVICNYLYGNVSYHISIESVNLAIKNILLSE